MKFLLLGTLAFLITGCISTYRDFPTEGLGKKPVAANCDVMHYNINNFNILSAGGGYNRLKGIFKESRICRKMVPVDEKTEKGIYVEVNTKWKPMTMPAFVFTYLSLSTLTIIPSWSMHDGYNVNYAVYVNGEKKETFQYDATRKAGTWLFLLPFAWINAATYSEDDIFEAMTFQFSSDAQALLGAKL